MLRPSLQGTATPASEELFIYYFSIIKWQIFELTVRCINDCTVDWLFSNGQNLNRVDVVNVCFVIINLNLQSNKVIHFIFQIIVVELKYNICLCCCLFVFLSLTENTPVK